MSEHRPHRVRVTSPQATRPGSGPRRSAASEMVAQSDLGEIYLGALLRAQLRLAFRTTAALVLTVGMLPVVFHLWPGLTERQVFGMPVSWLILGLGVFPVLLLLAWWHIRAAERAEDAFTHVAESS